MHSDVAISVKNLTKTYRIFGHPGDRIKQALTFGRMRFHREFTALKDVSFEIRKGETVGIIGRNGSGKSTLLQLICGILKPTLGSVQTNGRVSALLELGAGFNPEFTGRENVYFQGAVMGLKRSEIDERFNEIAGFADIGEFIDQPVRIYSSGMFVRLAFAVAVNVDPDVLIVDEALAVGDMEFQERSISRMKSLQSAGTTILLVTHAMPAVRNFCQRAIWLDDGTVMQSGEASQVCAAYQERINQDVRRQNQTRDSLPAPQENRDDFPSRQGKIISIAKAEVENRRLDVGGSLALRFSLRFSGLKPAPAEFGLGVQIHNDQGKLIAIFNTLRDNIFLSGTAQDISLCLPNIGFMPGHYWVSANVCDRDAMFAYDEFERCASFEVLDEFNHKGIPRWEGEVACAHTWLW
ncbi:ABC-type polysaccharide/polyol phosphate transport system, ATPase component [Polaromonas sp. CF318]|uniref:ABC transporter ATP-binding protein n=1 Tax=Polaromonas sp. CF318 TaxID=1144318 RepID=UPI00027144C7|nr:polysaccharide ABC transporter ATP-binding protein [Polaromonas sp. CF318]EJL82717.1 ABC-type polysaccharide/polyol phosphate transport system, ATPase component [Polaromonas sp. CF318]